MNRKITIAIDGHSSTGKSTAAKQLATALNYIYIDTGAMYRAVAFFALSENLITSSGLDKSAIIGRLPEVAISFKWNEASKKAEVHLNGKSVESEIRTLAVSDVVSLIAEISEVRKKLVHQQQLMGAEKGVVMDGRDIGTVVFPDAELKVFMTAAPEVRAQRRYQELKDRGDEVQFDEVLHNVIERDRIDSTREDSPLIQANDALLLDTSTMTREQQFKQLLQWSEQAGASLS